MTTHPDDQSLVSAAADRLWIAVSEDGLLRARAARTTDLVRAGLERHAPGPLGALALARALSATAVFPVEWEKNDRVSVQWSGGGPLGSVHAELRQPGHLRARLTRPHAEARATQAGRWRGVGLGLLPGGFVAVLRQDPRGGHVQGQVPLRNGEIDEDLEDYFEKSEQVATRLRTFVDASESGIVAAGALVVQALPGAEGCDLPAGAALERLGASDDVERWLEAAFQRPFRILEERPLAFACACSRERAAAGISLLSQEELIDMVVKDKGADVTCEYCAEGYRFSPEDLLAILDDKFAEAPPETVGEA